MTPPEPLRVVLYARVSAANATGDTTSVDDQLAALRALADRHGLRIVAEHTDRAISASGAAKDRPGWSAVLRAVTTGQADAVGLWEVSRSSRRLGEWVSFRDVCRPRRVLWLTPAEGLIDPNGPRDRLGLGVKAVVAEEEAAQTSDRIRRTVRAKAAEGRPHGRETYGYRRAYDPATGRLVGVEVHPEEAATVRRIVEHVLAGGSLRALARQLDAEGVPTPTAAVAARRGATGRRTATGWTPTTLRRIAANRSYTGRRVHRERDRFDPAQVLDTAEHAAVWPALVTDDEHAEVLALLADPTRNDRAAVTDAAMRHYLNGGLLVCAKCEGALTWVRQRRGPERFATYYGCTRPGCRGVVVAEQVEDMVAEVVVARLAEPDAAPALGAVGPEVDTVAARAVLTGATKRLDDLAAAYAAGSLSLAAYTAAEKLLADQQATARGVLAAASAPGLPDYARDLADPAAAWEGWTAGQRNAVTRALMTRVVVRPSGRTGRPPRGTRPVAWSRLGFLRTGTDRVVWGVDDPAEQVTA